jgi:hypothetical protein
MSRTIVIVVAVALVAVVVVGALYQWLVPGLSSARTEPGQVETRIATWLLHRSVPADAEARTPVENAARMMKQQRRFGVPHEFRDLTRKLAVRDANAFDCHLHSPTEW